MHAKLTSRNPATGEIIREINVTDINDLPLIFQKAREAQAKWALLRPKDRARHIGQLRETILDHIDDLAELISQENGKPFMEAMATEIFPSLEALRYFAKVTPRLMKDRPIPLGLTKHRKSYYNYWPVGTIAVIAPWNYPLLIPFSEIVMALVTGNSVIFKPSEITPLIGLKIQELCDEAGLPPNIIQTVIGDGSLGAAIIENKPAKIFFTGSAATGKKIMAAAAQHLIPVNLELGGNNAMIVLPDADLDFATSAALWGCFANSGQVCAATERLLVHEKLVEPFVSLFKEKISKLRQGNSATKSNDLGPITFDKQKSIYVDRLNEAKAAGMKIITGGEFNPADNFLKPSVIMDGGNGGAKLESLKVYSEETFGSIITISPFKTPAEAIQKTNDTAYGLTASIITNNLELAESIAKQLEVGTVTINEAFHTAGVPETPWGGVKASGFGRTHAEVGLMECVNIRHINRPKTRFLSFKSLWWFPYSPYQLMTFRRIVALYRKNWLDKIRDIPHLLFNFVKFIKEEKRL